MIKIVLAEDQKLLASALATLLDFEEDIEVVGQGENGEEAIKLCDKYKPDICLVDIEMPKKSGLEVAEELKNRDIKVVILTTFEKEGYFERAMKADVYGYLLKDTPSDELAEMLRKVKLGKRFYSPQLITGFYSKSPNPLTEREREILRVLNKGYTTKEISEKLFLSKGTVRNYISEIFDKLGAKNRIDAVSIAKEKGFLE